METLNETAVQFIVERCQRVPIQLKGNHHRLLYLHESFLDFSL